MADQLCGTGRSPAQSPGSPRGREILMIGRGAGEELEAVAGPGCGEVTADGGQAGAQTPQPRAGLAVV
ncbi:hypothetical protein [Streptosporangium canum]|uniref:hypothetical protein n=1 Tax=Streptosporangium canum TaxID=324952 RepID=UPI0033B6F050